VSYILPNNVTHPIWKLIGVILDEGDPGVSIAFGEWDDEYALVSRWNNPKDPRGFPANAWFVIPKMLHRSTLASLSINLDLRIDREALKQAIAELCKE